MDGFTWCPFGEPHVSPIRPEMEPGADRPLAPSARGHFVAILGPMATKPREVTTGPEVREVT